MRISNPDEIAQFFAWPIGRGPLVEDFTSEWRVNEGLPLRVFGEDAGQFGVNLADAGEFALALAKCHECGEIHDKPDAPSGPRGQGLAVAK